MVRFFTELMQERAYQVASECYDEFEALADGAADMAESFFNPMPNVIQVVASACQVSYHAKKTRLEHKYGKSLEEMCPNFAFAPVD
jgi:glucose-6-phosphate isomerase